jgi:hypothetical protein
MCDSILTCCRSYMLRHHASEDIAVGKISSDLQHQKVKLESKINSLRSALRGSVDSSDVSCHNEYETTHPLTH